MAEIRVWIFIILFSENIYNTIAQQEFCVDESFNPQCQSDEIILMESALYGRMNLGRCLPTDLGYMGCQADVLAPLDEECSGKPSCNVLVADKRLTAKSGCLKGLQNYLLANYICVKELTVQSTCSTNLPLTIDADLADFYLSDLMLKEVCPSGNKGFNVKVKDGQVMNISQVNLQHSIVKDDNYGTIRDVSSDTNVIFGDGPRDLHLLFSSSNEVEIKISHNDNSNNRFMLHFTVSGCPNMPPPKGAWMTRDSDVMEIGCHSGTKVWSLKCQDNQWVGAVGQCGRLSDAVAEVASTEKNVLTQRSLSMNAMLFGICSLIILLSAIIFLSGVCLLKRKIDAPVYNYLPGQRTIRQALPRDMIQENAFFTQPRGFLTQQDMALTLPTKEPGYKSLQMGHVAISNNANIHKNQAQDNDAAPAYMNTGSDAGDSVKYFVLEDASKNI